MTVVRDVPLQRDHGFTLVEVLVALAILGVAAVGLIGAVETHVDNLGRLQARTIAQWVAENEIAERTVLADAAPQDGEIVEMLDRRWSVRVAARAQPSADDALAALVVSVAEAGAREPLVAMDFFVEAPRGGR